MASEGQWQSLIAQGPLSPAIFIKSVVTSNSCSITLTDLDYLWQQDLDERDIVERAEQLACPIRPSEDRKQLEILLETIRRAIDGSSDTSLGLKTDDKVKDALSLDLTAALPAPLPVFKWRFCLQKQDAESFTYQITCPLLLSNHTKRTRIEDLCSHLRDKDRVIARLLDRLESSGTDLTTVFPGTSNVKTTKRQSQRSQLGKYVKGLDPFDGSSPMVVPDTPHVDDLFHALEGPEIGHIDTMVRSLGSRSSNWWKTADLTKGQVQSSKSSLAQSPERAGADSESESTEFQVQDISSKRSAKAVSPDIEPPLPTHDTDETESDDLDSVPKQPQQPLSTRSPASRGLSISRDLPPSGAGDVPRSPKRLGTIGGKKVKSQAVRTSDSRSPSQSPTEQQIQPVTSQSDTSQVKGQRKIGVIGGRKVRTEAASNVNGDPNEAVRDDVPKQSSMTPSATKTVARPQDPGADRQRGKSTASPTGEGPVQPRETSQERANRRREDLKRQLATSTNAAAKKKRKF